MMKPEIRRRLRVVFDDVDASVAATRQEAEADGFTIPCREGCANCCMQEINASPLEVEACVDLYAKRFGDDALPLLAQHAETQLHQARRVNGPVGYVRLQMPCLFLKDSRCTVYEVRPLVCRWMIVASDPSGCNDPRKTVQTLNVETAVALGTMGVADLEPNMFVQHQDLGVAPPTDRALMKSWIPFQRLLMEAIALRRTTAVGTTDTEGGRR